ncbi:MAG: translation initiation factor [Candidatus Hydrogenedens sp.]|nr:translation initiation factor [Candidatus Hydrogenedentota bacterium]NLF57660.1 translation initiation factor [Candidatus Hydrogenedens sp.]
MKEKKERLDTSGPAAPLTFSPFAGAFGGVAVPEGDSAGTPALKPEQGVHAFQIARTKKGGYAVSVERRAGGKSVTILRNVSGDTHALLALLKKHCAAGGRASEDTVEIQGEHTEKICSFLRGRGL